MFPFIPVALGTLYMVEVAARARPGHVEFDGVNHSFWAGESLWNDNESIGQLGPSSNV